MISLREVIRDFEGCELADVDAAVAEALEDARMLMSDAVGSGKDLSARKSRSSTTRAG